MQQHRQASPLLAPSDIGASAELLRGEEFFKFTFVRNPFDRLLSCFLNKISRPTVQRQLLLAQMGRRRAQLPTGGRWLKA